MMTYNWVQRTVEAPEKIASLQQELNMLPEALARSLLLRGIDSYDKARLFFRPSIQDLHDPFLMKDMDVAADRVAEAIARRERVLVYGDYDVDGTTSTAMMVSFLQAHGLEPVYFIPDRVKHGYGLCNAGIDEAVNAGASLIIALDCGITAVQQAEYVRARGLELIICDHHKPDHILPDAFAVLNPKRPDCSYPFDELSGCGVGFKLIQAIMMRLGEPFEEALGYLDLVAISIASDIVPLNGENRLLMAEGLKTLTRQPRVGIQKLAASAGMDLNDCSTSRIVFGLGPRINAAGRMGDASRAVDLMLESDPTRAAALAAQLEEANRERRSLDHSTLDEATREADLLLNEHGRNALVLFAPHWHLGVIGIVASRIVERYYRPTIMLATSHGVVKGSARSIQGVNIYNALRACEGMLTTFGGHDYAAGLTLQEDQVDSFRDRFDEVVGQSLTPELLTPSIFVDAPVKLDEIDRRFWAVLRQFAPHGPANDTPIFEARGLEPCGEPMAIGKTGEHLKFIVRQQHDHSGLHFEALGFGMRPHFPAVQESRRTGRPLDALFSVQENVWNGRSSLQLRLRDLRLSEAK